MAWVRLIATMNTCESRGSGGRETLNQIKTQPDY
jgi:hypothetical protein